MHPYMGTDRRWTPHLPQGTKQATSEWTWEHPERWVSKSRAHSNKNLQTCKPVHGRKLKNDSFFKKSGEVINLYLFQNTLWGTPILPISRYLCPFPELKRLGPDVNQSPWSSAQVKYECSYTCTPLTRLHGMNREYFFHCGTVWSWSESLTSLHYIWKCISSSHAYAQYTLRASYRPRFKLYNNKTYFYKS